MEVLSLYIHIYTSLFLSSSEVVKFFSSGYQFTQEKNERSCKNCSTHQSLPLSISTQNLFSTALRSDINEKPLEKKMFMPFSSFTSLLMEDDDEEDEHRFASIEEQTDQIDQLIKTQGDNLRRTLADLWRRQYGGLQYAAEERAAKRLREKELELDMAAQKNAELIERAARFRTEAQVWQEKVKGMEQTINSLRAALHEVTVRGESTDGGWRLGCVRCGEEAEQPEDAESSFVDPERVEPVRLACKVCGKRVATVMMWPCRHVCVCMRCDIHAKTCPVCLSPKNTSVEVCLPLDP